MNLLNIDVRQLPWADIIDAYTKVYGDEYRDVIEKRVNQIIFITYNNVDGIKSYIHFLESCKQKELGIKFLQQIGIDVSKYEGRSFAEDLDKDTNALLDAYLGGYPWGIDSNGLGIKAWYHPQLGGMQRKKHRIEFINFLRGQDVTPITRKTYKAFCETDEYQEILGRIEEYLQIHSQLLEEYERYMQEIEPYRQYVRDEEEREGDLIEQLMSELCEQIEGALPAGIKTRLNNEDTSMEDIFIGDDFGMKSYAEYFSQEDEDKLNDSSTDETDKDDIYCYRCLYLSHMGVANNIGWPWPPVNNSELYNWFLQQDGVKELIPSTELVGRIAQLRTETYTKFQEELIYGSKDFAGFIAEHEISPGNRQLIYEVIRDKEVCVCDETYNNELLAVLFFSVRNDEFGMLDYLFLHEICHAIELENSSGLGIKSGFSNHNEDLIVPNPYNNQEQKYQRLNETIADIFAMEARQILQKRGIYMFEPREHVFADVSNHNTSSIIKKMLTQFLTRYRKPIIQARLFGDMEGLFDIIGEENFEELNDAVNKVDYLLSRDPHQKIGNKYSAGIGYLQEFFRLAIIYANMEDHQSGVISREKLIE